MTQDGSHGSTVFERLVAALSGEERQEMLARLRFSQLVEEAPLRESEASPEARFDRVFAELTFFERLILFLQALLTGKDRVVIVGELSLRRIGRGVAAAAHSQFNARSLELRNGFFERLEELRGSLELFRGALHEALGAHKKEFVAFLAGVEMPIVQEQLLRESDPENLDRSSLELSGFDIKRTVDSAVLDALDTISDSDRQLMYRDVQLLHSLQGIVDFSFDRLISRLRTDDGNRSRPAATLIAPLKELAAVLGRLTVPPSTQLVSSLFLFSARDRLEDAEFDLEASLRSKIEQAREGLAAIRRFNAAVPLNDIIRLTVKDADWMPAPRGGGEDWFALYKQFWFDRLDERTGRFLTQRKRRQLLEAAVKMLHLGELPYLKNYRTTTDGSALAFSHEHSIAFLRGFLNQVYERELVRPVKVFLIDGSFYKEQNRKDFADASAVIDRLGERMRTFEKTVDAEGSHGKLVAQAMASEGLPASRAKAVAQAVSAVDKDAEAIVSDGRRNLLTLQSVLDGILHGHGDESFDTISNLGQIGGRDNAKLVAALRMGLGHLAAANEILGGLLELEGDEGE